jgi:hypothetical protein
LRGSQRFFHEQFIAGSVVICRERIQARSLHLVLRQH